MPFKKLLDLINSLRTKYYNYCFREINCLVINYNKSNRVETKNAFWGNVLTLYCIRYKNRQTHTFGKQNQCVAYEKPQELVINRLYVSKCC